MLRRSSDFGASPWAASPGVVVTPNSTTDPSGATSLADGVLIPLSGSISQATISATTGPRVTAFVTALRGSWSRVSVTGTFNGVAYTGSLYVMANTSDIDVSIALGRSGGLLVFSVEDLDAVGPLDLSLAWAQLEIGSTATVYIASHS